MVAAQEHVNRSVGTSSPLVKCTHHSDGLVAMFLEVEECDNCQEIPHVQTISSGIKPCIHATTQRRGRVPNSVTDEGTIM